MMASESHETECNLGRMRDPDRFLDEEGYSLTFDLAVKPASA
jgi:hypothetical protein